MHHFAAVQNEKSYPSLFVNYCVYDTLACLSRVFFKSGQYSSASEHPLPYMGPSMFRSISIFCAKCAYPILSLIGLRRYFARLFTFLIRLRLRWLCIVHNCCVWRARRHESIYGFLRSVSLTGHIFSAISAAIVLT